MNPLLAQLLRGFGGEAVKWVINQVEERLKGKSVVTDRLLEVLAPILVDAGKGSGRLSAAKRNALQAKIDQALALVGEGV
jgi:hypothetical protein